MRISTHLDINRFIAMSGLKTKAETTATLNPEETHSVPGSYGSRGLYFGPKNTLLQKNFFKTHPGHLILT
jgi:hypothetical protein